MKHLDYSAGHDASAQHEIWREPEHALVTPAFGSYFMAGFECSTHRRFDKRRLDLIAGTKHDRFVASDYQAVATHGMKAARDGLRWHMIETAPGVYDWSSWLPMLRAAIQNGVTISWDLCHYGWPDDLDIYSPEFVTRFAAFAEAAARVFKEETDAVPVWCPVNEISYFAFAAGEIEMFYPFSKGRGGDVKRQLVRAALAGVDAVRRVDPRARIVWAEPAINVAPFGDGEQERIDAENFRQSQFEALDMLGGYKEPELGGRPDVLDIIGVNYYPQNQWYLGGSTIPIGHHAYKPFSEMLLEFHERYGGRPMIVAETGGEASGQSSWLHYVGEQTRLAIAQGVDVQGICLYPITNYPGWENERVCTTGLLSYADAEGRREVNVSLARELRRQQALFVADDARVESPALVAAAE
jgi:beta-glucosidase/6-phospho-beta-glucosidase/beta-galactosidase